MLASPFRARRGSVCCPVRAAVLEWKTHKGCYAPRVHGLGRRHPAETNYYSQPNKEEPAESPAGFTIGSVRAK
jgi:hypothetical protein